MRIHKFVLVAVGSLALWGCGGDDDADVAAVPSVVDDVLPTAPPAVTKTPARSRSRSPSPTSLSSATPRCPSAARSW
jgi:hypothetical protein